MDTPLKLPDFIPEGDFLPVGSKFTVTVVIYLHMHWNLFN